MMSITLTTVMVTLALPLFAEAYVKRVVGGTPYDKNDYPFHASLWYMGENNFYTAPTPGLHHTCGGSLLKEDWVLTAGICFDDNFLPGVSNVSLWKVVLGMYAQTDAESEAQFRTIDSIYWPDAYNLTTMYGDLALLKLSEPAELNDVSVAVTDFNKDDDCPVTDETCTVIGWGQTTESDNVPMFPQEAQVQVIDTDECRKNYEEAPTTAVIDNQNNICAGVSGGGVDACAGDSGSPLLCQCGDDGTAEVVVATVSYGYGCARPDYPGVYTRISQYADWIDATINQ